MITDVMYVKNVIFVFKKPQNIDKQSFQALCFKKAFNPFQKIICLGKKKLSVVFFCFSTKVHIVQNRALLFSKTTCF